MTVAVDALRKRMEDHPEEFTQRDKYTLIHKGSRTEVWVANGFLCYGFYSGGPSFSFFDKIKFARAYSKWKAWDLSGHQCVEDKKHEV